MLKIRPFKGIRYNVDKIKDLAYVTAPPYDVINPRQQEEYYKLHDYNVIRLILGKEMPGDDENENKYTRAGVYWRQWLAEGILIREDEPSLYLYVQEFFINGQKYTRTGLIAAVELSDFSEGNVLPHEKTLAHPKVDRLNIMRACQANLSQVFGLFKDEDKVLQAIFDDIVKKSPPLVSFQDKEQVIHKLWKITDEQMIYKITGEMARRKIYIADGHHRYETALAYKKERMSQGNHTGNENYNYISMVLVSNSDPGLVVLPTHRLVFGLTPDRIKKLLNLLPEYFIIDTSFSNITTGVNSSLSEFSNILQQKGCEKTTFGMYTKKTGLVLLTVTDHNLIFKMMGNKHSDAWKKLDVAVLHEIILHQLLGLSEESMTKQENLKYTRDMEEVIKEVNSGNCQLGFFLNPTEVNQVINVAEAGDTMPQKSTFFYPKLISGLIFHEL